MHRPPIAGKKAFAAAADHANPARKVLSGQLKSWGLDGEYERWSGPSPRWPVLPCRHAR